MYMDSRDGGKAKRGEFKEEQKVDKWKSFDQNTKTTAVKPRK